MKISTPVVCFGMKFEKYRQHTHTYTHAHTELCLSYKTVNLMPPLKTLQDLFIFHLQSNLSLPMLWSDVGWEIYLHSLPRLLCLLHTRTASLLADG